VNNRDDDSGIVLQCDPSGEIIRIIRDDLGITAGSESHSTLFGIVDQDSQEKAQEFLRAAFESHATFGWELNVRCDNQLTGLLLTGGLTDAGIIVCGSPSRAGINKLFDEMTEIQNEQLNALRMTLKEVQLETTRYRQHDEEMLAEFTRLNNELVNTQRELARRNADIADANVRLEALATTDGLTGLKNHREFQDSLEREYVRAARYGTPLSLLMMDVDHFKQFNDQFGHPAGDSVLMQVASILTRESRSEAVVARYGGEEFAVILPTCGCEAAVGVAERIRRAVELGPWDLRTITVSIGSATMIDGELNRAALIARADAAMYQAKVSGRNQVCSTMGVCGSAPAMTK
jgi:diguanylate cyclase (GGDEF)-like protein